MRHSLRRIVTAGIALLAGLTLLHKHSRGIDGDSSPQWFAVFIDAPPLEDDGTEVSFNGVATSPDFDLLCKGELKGYFHVTRTFQVDVGADGKGMVMLPQDPKYLPEAYVNPEYITEIYPLKEDFVKALRPADKNDKNRE